MRKLKDTIPLDPNSLTECPCRTGRAHLRCDCPLEAVRDDASTTRSEARVVEVGS